MFINGRINPQLRQLKLQDDNNRNGNDNSNTGSNNLPSNTQLQAPMQEPVTASALEIVALYNTPVQLNSTNKILHPGMNLLFIDGVKVKVWIDENGRITQVFGGNKSFKEILEIIDREYTVEWNNNSTDSALETTPDEEIQEEEPQTANSMGVNGEIDEFVSQGNTGDCWLLVGILGLASTEVGRNIIKSCIRVEGDSVFVTFKGFDIEIEVKGSEIRRYDKDDSYGLYSDGDNDMLALELAMEKLYKMIAKGEVNVPEEINAQGYFDNDYNRRAGKTIEGGLPNEIIYALTGVIGDVHNTFEEWLNNGYIIEKDGEYYFNGKTQKQYDRSLGIGLEYNTVENLLNQYGNNPNCVLTFGLYSYYKKAKVIEIECLNGKVFKLELDPKGGNYCGHALTITNVDTQNKTVTFINPWDSTDEYEMTWEKFASIGIGSISSMDLSSVADEYGDTNIKTEKNDINDFVNNQYFKIEDLLKFFTEEQISKYFEKYEGATAKDLDGNIILVSSPNGNEYYMLVPSIKIEGYTGKINNIVDLYNALVEVGEIKETENNEDEIMIEEQQQEQLLAETSSNDKINDINNMHYKANRNLNKSDNLKKHVSKLMNELSFTTNLKDKQKLMKTIKTMEQEIKGITISINEIFTSANRLTDDIQDMSIKFPNSKTIQDNLEKAKTVTQQIQTIYILSQTETSPNPLDYSSKFINIRNLNRTF